MFKKNSNGTIDTTQIVPKNPRQRDLLKALTTKKCVVALGSAGTGKTLLTCKYIAENIKDIDQVVLTRPNVGVEGKELGFLPGTLNKKLDPWLAPIFQYLKEFGVKGDNKIERQALYLIRGMSYNNSFIYVDECQNMTEAELKALLTRIGEGSKIFLTGDPSQSDLKNPGINIVVDAIKNKLVDDCALIEFTHKDILRSKMCMQWQKVFDKNLKLD